MSKNTSTGVHIVPLVEILPFLRQTRRSALDDSPTQTFANIVKHTMARNEYGDIDVTQTSDYPYATLIKVLIPVTVVGWLMAGVFCATCINMRGRAGRWVPEWYLDSHGTKVDMLLVVAWWAVVVVFWPVITVVMFARFGCRIVGKRARKWHRGDEEAKGAAGGEVGAMADVDSTSAVLGTAKNNTGGGGTNSRVAAGDDADETSRG